MSENSQMQRLGNIVNKQRVSGLLLLIVLFLLIPAEGLGQRATVTGTTTVCQNDVFPILTFEGFNGTTPYTFTYNINGVVQSPVITSGGNSTYTVSAPTTTPGTFIYELISAIDGLGDPCAITGPSATITVNALPGPAGTIAGLTTVCQGQTGVVYNVPVISSATGYTWTLPAGASITAGLNTNIITVAFSASAVSGNITVVGTNSCGSGTVSLNRTVTVSQLAAAAGTISGTPNVCQGQTGVGYSVSVISNATGYTWTLPAGATITAGSNTNNITVSFSASASTGNITVQGTNSCGSGTISANYAVTVNPLPAAAGSITGPATVCQGQSGVVYTVPSIASATGYTWTLPTGASITAGSNTNSITVTFSSSAATGNITVQGTNLCGNGTVSSGYPVTVSQLPATAGAVTGLTTVCQGQTGVVYSVPAINRATGYTWSLPSGATITAGSNTNSITVAYSASAVSGNIIVQGTNSCGSGSVSSNHTVTVNQLPATAGTISGTPTVCQGQTGVGYSVPLISNATGYVWTLPAGATITAGSNTNSITVSYSASAISGNITVLGTNGCGNGIVSSNYAVSVTSLPAAAGTISGTAAVCQGKTGVGYSVPAINNATGYTWTLPAGATITAGSNTNNITVSFSASASTGNITVQGTNSCGSGTISANYAVTVNPLPAAAGSITGPATVCQGQSGVVYTVPSIASATGYTWTLPTGASITAGSNTNSITITFSASAATGNVTVLGTNLCGSGTISSNYAVTVNPFPAAAGTITGTSTVCQGQSGVAYSVPSIASATGYTWTLPAGAAITAGSNTNSITVSYSSSSTSGSISVMGTNACGNGIVSANFAVSVNPLPAAAGSITGSATVCQGQAGAIYTVAAIASATGYTWTLPAGATITSGSNSNSITVTFSASASSGNITVLGTNSCGAGTLSTSSVTVNQLPVAAGTITGPATVCQGEAGAVYTVPAIASATGYTWTLPVGGSITAGSNTNSITVTYSANATSGNITVTGNNTCGNGIVSANYAVTVNSLPAAAGTITGPASVCQGQSGVIYSIPSVASATGYTWTLPTGASITAGLNTNSITVTYSASAESGNITVLGTNSCGNGILSPNNPVIVNIAPVIPVITPGGTTSICTGSSVNLTSSAGTSYLWSTGATTASINVTAAGTYSVSITNASGCQSAPSAAATVIVNPIPSPTIVSSDIDNFICQGTSVTFTATGGTSYSFRVAGVIVQTGASPTFTTGTLINGQVVDVIATNATGCSATSTGITNFVNALPFIIITTPATCSPDLTTYSLLFGVSTGTVTSSSGTVTNVSGNSWSLTGVLAGTNVTIRVVDANGCETVLIVTAPNCSCPVMTAPVSGGDKSYCESGIIPTINATILAGETIDWYNSSSGGTLLKASSLSYTPASAGTYYALARNIITSCVSSTRTAIKVTMNTLPVPTLTSSDSDNIICKGDGVTFTASGGTSYNFRVGGLSVQNGTTATYTTSSLTNNQLTDVIVTNASGCTATSVGITNIVSALPVPTLTSSDADNTLCAGTSVTFTAGGGTNFNFRVGGVSVQRGISPTYTTNSLTNNQLVDVIVTNANNCSATSAGIINSVFSPLTITLTSSDADNVFCSGTSVTFTATGGTTYNFRVGGVSVQSGALSTYTTSSLTNGQSVDAIISNATGCSAVSTAIINTVNPMPSANAGTGGNECDLDFKFSAVAGIGTGTWTLTSGPGTASFTPSANTATSTVTVSAYGTYTFTWTEVIGTCSKSSAVSVNFYQQPVANAGTGGNNCGLEFYFTGSVEVGTGTWSKVSGPGNVTFTPNANAANALVAVTAYGNYTFRWSVVNGTCSNSSTVAVNFILQPPADAGKGGSECDKDFILSALTPSGTGTWTKISGPGNAVFSPDNHQPNAKVTVDQFGTYRFSWTTTNVSCSSSDIVEVIFHDLPSVNAGTDTVICKGTSIQLDAQGVGSFAWSPPNLVNNPALKNPTVAPESSTTFTVVLTDQFGCKNSDGVLVEVREKPFANAGPDQILEYVFETTMKAVLANPFETGKWSVISGTGKITDISLPTSSVGNLSVDENKFLWTVTNNGCPSSSDTVNIKVRDFIVPSLITPNMDGNNDYFVLRGSVTLGKTELTIFDRRGAQVYKNSNYDNKWNGVDYNENPLPEDTYYYVLRSENGKSLSGYIVIRR